MPELPEVETVRRDLRTSLKGKKIASLKIMADKIAPQGEALLKRALVGNSFKDVDRIGKLLIFKLAKVGNRYDCLLIHLKMTGQLIYKQGAKLTAGGHSLRPGSLTEAVGGELPNRSTRALLGFEDQSQLFFNDLRKFGYLKLVSQEELLKIKQRYGIEPLTENFTKSSFIKALERRKKNIKAVLLDQMIISGLGNIYADETLFAAGIRPQRLASSLKNSELDLLYKQIQVIIKKAIERRGTTFSTYVDGSGKKGNFTSLLKVYGRGGKPCSKCGQAIKKVKFAGRGTHYCQNCQK